jgi:hypothetical protein
VKENDTTGDTETKRHRSEGNIWIDEFSPQRKIQPFAIIKKRFISWWYLIFDILSLKFRLVDCVWDKIMIYPICHINIFSSFSLHSVELFNENNRIIQFCIFKISVHWNNIRNLRKHQIFPLISDFLSFSADRFSSRDTNLSLWTLATSQRPSPARRHWCCQGEMSIEFIDCAGKASSFMGENDIQLVWCCFESDMYQAF